MSRGSARFRPARSALRYSPALSRAMRRASGDASPDSISLSSARARSRCSGRAAPSSRYARSNSRPISGPGRLSRSGSAFLIPGLVLFTRRTRTAARAALPRASKRIMRRHAPSARACVCLHRPHRTQSSARQPPCRRPRAQHSSSPSYARGIPSGALAARIAVKRRRAQCARRELIHVQAQIYPSRGAILAMI